VQDFGRAKGPDVRGSEGHEGNRLAAPGYELDFERIVVMAMDHGAHVSGGEPVLGQVTGQDDGIEFGGHAVSRGSGNAVMK
jgi:hypothetical protein